jgi:hypothetical protein
MIAIALLFVRMLSDCFKSRSRLEAEIVVLRHQLNVLRQRAPRRLYLRWADRVLFVWLIFYSCGAGMVCKSLILREMRVGFRQNVVPRHDTFVLMYMDFDVIMC